MVDRLVEAFRTRADDVANWPNVRSFPRSLLNGATDRHPFLTAFLQSRREREFPGFELYLAGAH